MIKTQHKQLIYFIILMGVVNLFADMTHEGARSIYGAYLSFQGLTAAQIGFVTGVGEFIGYGLRLISGNIVDRTQRYWPAMTIGFVINVLSVPALVFCNRQGWLLACVLIISERAGRAIRLPANNTMLSFAGSQMGNGRAFALEEFLDSIGSFLGPVYLYLIMTLGVTATTNYQALFAWLIVPAILTLVALMFAHQQFPRPEKFEPDNVTTGQNKIDGNTWLYVIGIVSFALGFMDFPIITMHIQRLNLVSNINLPLLYALAMIIGAIATLVFGGAYDRWGIKMLSWSTLLAAPFSGFIFLSHHLSVILIGIVLWEIGMGAQESLMEAIVGATVARRQRARAFGFFDMIFGIAWFIGSWLLGLLYDWLLPIMVICSVALQLVAASCYLIINWRTTKMGAA